MSPIEARGPAAGHWIRWNGEARDLACYPFACHLFTCHPFTCNPFTCHPFVCGARPGPAGVTSGACGVLRAALTVWQDWQDWLDWQTRKTGCSVAR